MRLNFFLALLARRTIKVLKESFLGLGIARGARHAFSPLGVSVGADMIIAVALQEVIQPFVDRILSIFQILFKGAPRVSAKSSAHEPGPLSTPALVKSKSLYIKGFALCACDFAARSMNPPSEA